MQALRMHAPAGPALSTRVRQASTTRPCQPAISTRSGRQAHRLVVVRAEGEASTSAPTPSSDPAAAAAWSADDKPEEVFYEGNGSNVELGLSIALAATLLYIPLTIASIGRRLWIKLRVTNKRISVINTSPLFARQIDIAYSQVKEVRTAPRAFGAWGDMVIFLKNGDRLELVGIEQYKEIQQYIDRQRTMM